MRNEGCKAPGNLDFLTTLTNLVAQGPSNCQLTHPINVVTDERWSCRVSDTTTAERHQTEKAWTRCHTQSMAMSALTNEARISV